MNWMVRCIVILAVSVGYLMIAPCLLAQDKLRLHKNEQSWKSPDFLVGKMTWEDVKLIIEKHKKWIETDGRDGERANFESHILTGINLSNLNLSKAIFENANLENATFNNSDLSGVNFRKANLREAWIVKANLSETDLSDAILAKAYL